MSNDYFNATTVVTRLTTARASAINSLAAAIDAGFDKLPSPSALATGKITYAPDTGTANVKQMALPLITAYSDGLNVRFKVAATNTGATTIQVNDLGARAIRRSSGEDLNAGDLTAGSIHEVSYNGTFFELLTAVQSDVNEAVVSSTAAAASAAAALVSQNAAAVSAGAAAGAAAGAVSSAIGVTVQAYDGDLAGIAGLSFTQNEAPIFHTSAWQKYTVSGYSRSLLIATSAAAARNTLGVSMEFISRQAASGSATLDFTGFDPGKYDGYQFEIQSIIPSNNGQLLFVRTSSNGGSSYDAGTGYSYVYRQLNTTGSEAFTRLDGSAFINIGNSVGNDANEDGVSGSLRVHSAGIARRTIISFQGSHFDGSTEFSTVTSQGSRNQSAVVNALRFAFAAGDIASGTITMYGLRNAG